MTSFKSASLGELLAAEDLIPQAIIGQPVGAVVKDLGLKVEQGEDDFDAYEGSGVVVDDGSTPFAFALMHYAGHPTGTSTIYLPRRFEKIPEITAMVRLITAGLKIPENAIVWERRLGPQL